MTLSSGAGPARRSSLRSLAMRVLFAHCHRRARVHSSAMFLPWARVVNARGDRDAIRVGAHSTIRGELLVFGHGGDIEIGDWCYVGEGARIWSASRVRIGSRVLIAHGVNIHDTNSHPLDPVARHEHAVAIATRGHPKTAPDIVSLPVEIGDDAWVGFNAIILKGVTIGARAIIAAGSVVTEDVPADGVYAGHRLIRQGHA